MTLKIELAAANQEEMNQMVAKLAEAMGAVPTIMAAEPKPLSAGELLDLINEALEEQGLKAVIQDINEPVSTEEVPVEEPEPKQTKAKSKAKPKAAEPKPESEAKPEPDQAAVTPSEPETTVADISEDTDPETAHKRALAILMGIYQTDIGKDRVVELRKRWGVDRLSNIPVEEGVKLQADALALAEELNLQDVINIEVSK